MHPIDRLRQHTFNHNSEIKQGVDDWIRTCVGTANATERIDAHSYGEFVKDDGSLKDYLLNHACREIAELIKPHVEFSIGSPDQFGNRRLTYSLMFLKLEDEARRG